jgi:hypothetical protein
VPSTARTAETGDRVRDLQRTLYRAAKADSGRRFHALYDKIWRRDVLEWAWGQVCANRGAAGIDRVTLAEIEQYGVSRLLDELSAELRGHRWRPLPARRVWIPKPGRTEQRPLSIPSVRDRIVQAATKIVLEPVFEAEMASCSYGFRPKRNARQALQVLIDEAWRGRRWVVETDIASCFEAIPHDRLMAIWTCPGFVDGLALSGTVPFSESLRELDLRLDLAVSAFVSSFPPFNGGLGAEPPGSPGSGARWSDLALGDGLGLQIGSPGRPRFDDRESTRPVGTPCA